MRFTGPGMEKSEDRHRTNGGVGRCTSSLGIARHVAVHCFDTDTDDVEEESRNRGGVLRA